MLIYRLNRVKRMVDMSLREYDHKRDRFTEYYFEFEFEFELLLHRTTTAPDLNVTRKMMNR